ncbi:MAG: sigma 54-interacting transcriptional regulator [Myxococcales bacterium]|nr:sigma 54-interacting transcriptional regulator [Myxococcales bacterium]
MSFAVSESTSTRTVGPTQPESVLVVRAPSASSLHPLPREGVIDVGRDSACALTIGDDALSRRHARIVCGRDPTLEDLGSKNGTRLNGRTLGRGESAPLVDGAVIELGQTTILVRLTRPAAEAPDSTTIVAAPAMRDAYALLEIVAPTPISVLVLGETGVGKDVFAEALHRRSTRADKPFLRLNCAALPESILESELFGYERGAFTGATQSRAGLFESADGGTVFLDEIGDMPLATQAKLLRVLENGEVLRLGAHKPKRIDVRFVAATHRDLQAWAAEARFRSDLYFRLAGVVVTLPPLRERPSELPALVDRFTALAAQRLARPQPIWTEAARAQLLEHPWPGNVRELRNVVERAVLLSTGAIETSHLALSAPPPRRTSEPLGRQTNSSQATIVPPAAPAAPAPNEGGVRAELREHERARMLDALTVCGGNQSRAAAMLGMPRRTFVKRLDAYGFTRPRKG